MLFLLSESFKQQESTHQHIIERGGQWEGKDDLSSAMEGTVGFKWNILLNHT